MSTEETPIDTPAAAAVESEAPVEETKAEEPKEEESTATFEPIVSHFQSYHVISYHVM